MKKGKHLKAVLLAAQTIPITGFVLISPVLPNVAREFPQVSGVAIQMMVTLPAVCSLLFGQLSGWLSNFVNKRRLVLLGLLLFFAGGFGAYFIKEFWQLFLCRLLVGVGMGAFVPVNLSLISDFYNGDERTGTIGLSQAVNYLGGSLATIVAGLLAVANWRNVFLVNIAAAVVFAIDFLWLPSHKNSEKAATRKFQILPPKVYLYMLGAIAQMLVFYSCVTNFAARTQEMGSENSFYASIGIACLYLGCFLTGLILVRLKKMLGRFLPCASLCLLAGGFLCLFCAPYLGVLYLGVFLVGLGDGILIPYLMSCTANASPAAFSGQAMAAFNLGLALGQFGAPLFFAAVKTVFGATAAAGFFGVFCVLCAAAAASAGFAWRPAARKSRGVR